MNDILKQKIKVRTREIKEKISETVDDVKHGCEKTLEWCVDHPQETAIVLTVLGGAFGVAKKGIATYKQGQQLREDQRHRDYDIYDHSTGAYYTTKTKMSNNDILRMAELQKEYGYTKGEALRKMGKI